MFSSVLVGFLVFPIFLLDFPSCYELFLIYRWFFVVSHSRLIDIVFFRSFSLFFVRIFIVIYGFS